MKLAEADVKERLRTVGRTIESVPGLKEIFEEDSVAINPFSGVESEQQQHKFYREHFHLVVSLYSPIRL